jgi:methylthioribulose-1-phosphate dehydratase
MNQLTFQEPDLKEAQLLSQLVRDLNSQGHNPATSGNYSLRSSVVPGVALVSESGIDKSLFTENNFLLVEEKTGSLFGDYKDSGRKSSDETGLHLAIYNSTKAGCVLHSHLIESLLFSDLHPHDLIIEIEGLELLKGFKGVKTHEHKFLIPCLDNSQDIQTLSEKVTKILSEVQTYGFILRGHGVYVWGDTVKDAKRHLEVFEYIFKYKIANHRARLN